LFYIASLLAIFKGIIASFPGKTPILFSGKR